MADIITKFLINDEVSVTASDTTQLVELARTLHGTYPTSTAAFGRTLTAAVMMASFLKGKGQNLTVSINGGGPAGTVLATSDALGNVKGVIANPQAHLPSTASGKLDVGGIIGKDGFVTVSKNMGAELPYVGKTKLVSGEIAEDIANYYLESEQQPSIVYLSVWVGTDTSVIVAGGLIITPLPGASEETLSAIESRLFDISNYGIMLMGLTPEAAVKKIFSGMDIKYMSELHPKYNCDCSRERITEVIRSLGEDELQDIINTDGKAELVCRFCNKAYEFNKEELETILADLKTSKEK